MSSKTVTIIDRRLNPATRQLSGRQRFIERKNAEVRKAVNQAIKGGSVSGKYDDVQVDISGTQEPQFVLDGSGDTHLISPGNHWFRKGDKFRKSPQGGAGEGEGSGAGNGGGGEDSFSFILTRKEFMDIFFQDLGLPDLMRKANAAVEVIASQRAGYKPVGNPADLDAIKTAQNALARRIALRRPSTLSIENMKDELEELEKEEPLNEVRISEIKLFLEEAQARSKVVPWIDPVDTKYRQRVDVTAPKERVVMFCLMDVSGSMGEKEKDISKRYFMLLSELLNRAYGEGKVEIVYIRHHSEAEECSEHDFFYKKESGGTVVSSGINMIRDIIRARYPSNEWNIYIAQASDGDNWGEDNQLVHKVVTEDLLPICQYFTYIDIPRNLNHPSDLWPMYHGISQSHRNFAARQIGEVKEIWPVFQDLFKKARS